MTGVFVNSSCVNSLFPGWTLDSGVTDHVLFDINLFFDIKVVSENGLSGNLPNENLFLLDWLENVILLMKLCCRKCYLCLILNVTSFLCLNSPIPKFYSWKVAVHSILLVCGIIGWDIHLILFLHVLKFDLKIGNSPKVNVCDVCHRAKQAKEPFPYSEHKSIENFQLVHCDIWSPYRVERHSSFKYCLTLVDDRSRGIWVYLLKFKYEVCTVIKQFYNLIKI